MPRVISIEEAVPPFKVMQEDARDFIHSMFSKSHGNIERLLKVFINGEIQSRFFAKDLKWFSEEHSLGEKNDAFIESAVELGTQAIKKCLGSKSFLKETIPTEEIDAIFTICTTGFSTPSLEARIMNLIPFSEHTKRIPIWGLGCAGGASGLSRAFEYCLAFPSSKVLVLSIELCSLTFQQNDHSKSNLIGTSLFADGVACALVVGDACDNGVEKLSSPEIIATQSTLMKNSLDVMGWDMKDNGLHVIFSKDIPSIIERWLRPNVEKFLQKHGLDISDLSHFVAHPGGKKVIQAYQEALKIPPDMTETSLQVLKEFGNMSSATVLYVLKRFMLKNCPPGQLGLATALGPGFSSELLLLRWK
ncbi:type III polyketide synthase [Falsibacillus albus]|uniref:Type III polyketide synthase n=1 Tax=Falsibacillus albus TaxID=2478915 RepID=A0A3L7JWQ3_9BACI|nr:3-oxoacyl-[acyl-carrier-protein] synthase III C-terminal domain-containing protein [Falsibacillus albus]RLQ95153.1 type III polyketide synthase [Falsibacillus albus]